MEKQVLTRERILQDYKDSRQASLKPIIGLLIFLICILVLSVFVTIRMSKDGSALPALLLVCVVSFFVYICVAILISHYKDYQNIKQGRFYVVTDELIGKQEAEPYPTRFLWAFSQPAKLTFYAYGTFIPISNHTFDNPDLYAVSDTDNYISSSIGDKFLLVINKKSNILLVYNTKQFEYHS